MSENGRSYIRKPEPGRKRKAVVVVIVATVVIALLCAASFMYVRTKVAMIVNDERAWDLRDASPQMKVIITEGGMVARYLTEDEDNYIGEIQDSVWIPKSRSMVDIWYASDGRGIVFLNEPGMEPAYAAPDSLSDVVGRLEHAKGYIPETYMCKGCMDGWFSIEINGTTGYVREDLVCWDAIDSF